MIFVNAIIEGGRSAFLLKVAPERSPSRGGARDNQHIRVQTCDDLNDVKTLGFAVGGQLLKLTRPLQTVTQSHPPRIAEPEERRSIEMFKVAFASSDTQRPVAKERILPGKRRDLDNAVHAMQTRASCQNSSRPISIPFQLVCSMQASFQALFGLTDTCVFIELAMNTAREPDDEADLSQLHWDALPRRRRYTTPSGVGGVSDNVVKFEIPIRLKNSAIGNHRLHVPRGGCNRGADSTNLRMAFIGRPDAFHLSVGLLEFAERQPILGGLDMQ